jgi:acetyl esterase/lipase
MRTAISLFFTLCIMFAVGCLNAQTKVWQPTPGHTQIPIWPKKPPDAQPVPGPESLQPDPEYSSVSNVSRPTMTVYSPKAGNTGVAVIVFPGGGYQVLAIDLQGTEICDWLASKGITGILLKYRVPDSGPHRDPQVNPQVPNQVDPKAPMALEDAQRTLGLVRLHAQEWHIDPHKVGILGFSAGGHLVADISAHFEERSYPAVDAADKESCRPDFAAALYPGHLCNWPGHACSDETFELNPHIHVTKQTPPTFLLQAEDDDVDNVNQSLVYYIALKKASVPTEMHLYAEGGHGFGIRRTKFPITEWPQLFEKWLKTIGMISE